uniref:Pre-rRNA-processing protein TSR1 homolog n=1 Tax=Oncorhynchus tshawytscha TaxID=74940 RepID=A0A8C8INW4_ONCTS
MVSGGEQQQGHRASVFKQKNKEHKRGKHRRKGEIERENKGTFSMTSMTALTKKQKKEARKLDRRHKANQLRQNKKDLVRCSFDMHSLLDVVMVADSLVFVLDSTEGWDSYGDYCLGLFAQGLPAHSLVCQGVSDLAVKKRVDSRQALAKISKIRFPGARLFPLDSDQDATLTSDTWEHRGRGGWASAPVGLTSWVSRPYTPNSSEKERGEAPTGLGTLRVSGLVHISGFGNFQLSQIESPIDPLPLNYDRPSCQAWEGRRRRHDGGVDEMESVRVLMKADPARRESLQAEAEVGPMDGEQTWPTDTELLEAEEARKSKRAMKVPKGTSDYQATWIVDEEDENGEEDEVSTDDEEDDDAMMDESIDEEDLDSQVVYAASGGGSEEEEELNSTSNKGGSDQRYDEWMDEAEEGGGLKRYREARANEMFPDEVDTPLDQSAKNRFQRYRGLKSFRSSPWNPVENLPADYSRIFQFQSFERTGRRILAEAAQEEEGAMVGWYVTLHGVDVPPTVTESVQAGRPLVLVSLLPHEQKMSVMHMLLRRHPINTDPIKSKEELMFHCGFRRFRACAIFSQHTSADKHKLERFLRADAPTVVSVKASITFPTAGVLLFRQREDGKGLDRVIGTHCHSLLLTCWVRVVLKRIMLSGHPFKINHWSAVCRYIFFNRDDILWFKPVELRTKWGRRGHIKEALGTQMLDDFDME